MSCGSAATRMQPKEEKEEKVLQESADLWGLVRIRHVDGVSAWKRICCKNLATKIRRPLSSIRCMIRRLQETPHTSFCLKAINKTRTIRQLLSSHCGEVERPSSSSSALNISSFMNTGLPPNAYRLQSESVPWDAADIWTPSRLHLSLKIKHNFFF